MTRLLPLVIVLLAGCAAIEPVRQAIPPEPYPPYGDVALREIFEPQLRPLGVTLTRGGVAERGLGTYSPSPTGNHLALYVEPLGEWDAGDYTEGLVTVTKALAPAIFARWPGLDSFDVCQEPLPSEDESHEPPPVTQVTLSRAGSDAIDWERFDLEALLRLATQPGTDPDDFTTRPALVLAGERVTSHPRFEAAAEAAYGRPAPEATP